jgi:hypothetical protein
MVGRHRTRGWRGAMRSHADAVRYHPLSAAILERVMNAHGLIVRRAFRHHVDVGVGLIAMELKLRHVEAHAVRTESGGAETIPYAAGDGVFVLLTVLAGDKEKRKRQKRQREAPRRNAHNSIIAAA